MKPVATIEDVEIEIRHALLILKSLPKEGPKHLTAYWPEFLDENDEKKLQRVYIKPLPEEFDDMDIVFEKWMKILDYKERNLLLKRISGYGWKLLAYEFNKSRNTLHRYYIACLQKILIYAKELQKAENQLDVPPE